MVVDRVSLDVVPLVDKVFKEVVGESVADIEHEDITWSNELVNHVLELKVTEPVSELESLEKIFHKHILKLNELLASHQAMLLGTAMHPWMNPLVETVLWPEEGNVVYETFNSIFDCRGHGWANLQSAHLNLPFADDREFASLHSAIRLILPLLPALAASSPIMEEAPGLALDSRLEVYRHNCRKVPAVTGAVIPEAVYSMKDYEETILQPIYRDLNKLPGGNILCEEWVNARGAIARFQRGSIEIRVLDVQECPKADVAIQLLLVSVLKSLISERWSSIAQIKEVSNSSLTQIFQDCVLYGDQAVISDGDYLALFGCDRSTKSVKQLWEKLYVDHEALLGDYQAPLQLILEKGSLARRLLGKLAGRFDRSNLRSVYQELALCLVENRLFQ